MRTQVSPAATLSEMSRRASVQPVAARISALPAPCSAMAKAAAGRRPNSLVRWVSAIFGVSVAVMTCPRAAEALGDAIQDEGQDDDP